MYRSVSMCQLHSSQPSNSSASRAPHGVTAACAATWVVWGRYKRVANGGMVDPRRHLGRPWALEKNQWEYGGVP